MLYVVVFGQWIDEFGCKQDTVLGKKVKVANDTARQSKPMAQPPSRKKATIVASAPQLLEAKLATISLTC